MSEPSTSENQPNNDKGTPAYQPGRKGGKGNNPFRRNNKPGSSFKGATDNMNRHVFQT